MVRFGRILRDYRDTGAINGLLALWGFVDETTFLTKAGHVGVVYRLWKQRGKPVARDQRVVDAEFRVVGKTVLPSA